MPAPTFFAYPYPRPDGIQREPGWDDAAAEFLLAYDAVRAASDPRRALLEFLARTYDAGAGLAGWDEALAG